MNIMTMTKSDFKKVRRRTNTEDIGKFDSLVIIPTNDTHDSGYKCMEFCAVKDDRPICLMSGCSDTLHIEGIGGHGIRGNGFSLDSIGGWCIDCLPCGYFRLFCQGRKISRDNFGEDLSSFEIFSNI